MNRYFDKFLTTVLISSLLSTPGYSVMNPQDAPVEFDRKILVTSTPEESEQKILVMSTPDDEGQKIIVMSSPDDEVQQVYAYSVWNNNEEKQKVLINTIDKDLLDEGQRIYANLFQSGGIRVLSFKEASSLLSPLFSPGNKIYFGKGNKAEDDTDDHDKKIEISIPSGEKERVPVDINIMTRDWYDDYLRGQDEERQRELMNDIEYQIDNLDEDEKYVWVEKIKDGNESYEQIGGVLIDGKTEERTLVKLPPEDENGERKISIVIEDRHGNVVSEVMDIPYEGELKKKIEKYVDKNGLSIGLAIFFALSGIVGGVTVGTASILNSSNLLIEIGGMLLGIFGGVGAVFGGVYAGIHIGNKISSKPYLSHLRYLFDEKSINQEQRISHKHFRATVSFLSKNLLETQRPFTKRK